MYVADEIEVKIIHTLKYNTEGLIWLIDRLLDNLSTRVLEYLIDWLIDWL